MLLAAEYGRSIGQTTLGTTTTHVTSEHGYGLAGYRWRPWLQSTAYVSLLYPDVGQRSGREHHQYDTAGTVRFDLSPWRDPETMSDAFRRELDLALACMGDAFDGFHRTRLYNDRDVLAVRKGHPLREPDGAS